MTPSDLAHLHAKAFAPERGWSQDEFAALCDAAHVHLYCAPHGFALVRTIADEAELLTLAVDPNHHRQGIASDLMRKWMTGCKAAKAFLEVAEDNAPAIALYQRSGFEIIGRRKAYYARQNDPRVDALVMQAALTPGRGSQTTH